MALDGAVLGGRYVLDEQIGNGGYGEVWRATDTVLSRPVAVKLLHPRYTQRSEALARFRAEARHAGGLSHENIAQVFDYGEPADGQPPYLVMELVDGPSLETVLAGGPLDDSRTMDIVAQAAAGLQAAHAAGMIHRDIKPANLLLAPGGTVKITDFGIAHTIGSAPVTASGELIGTPGYLAPERAMGEQATPASDLYSLGMVAYECLAGSSAVPGHAPGGGAGSPGPPAAAAAPVGDRRRVRAGDAAGRQGSRPPSERRRRGRGVGGPAARWRRRGRRPAVAGPPGRRHSAASLFRSRTILAYACVAVTAVVVIVLASVIGFASTRVRSALPRPRHRSSREAAMRARRPTRQSAAPQSQPGPAARGQTVEAAASRSKPDLGPAVAVADPAGPDRDPNPGHGRGKGRDHSRWPRPREGQRATGERSRGD